MDNSVNGETVVKMYILIQQLQVGQCSRIIPEIGSIITMKYMRSIPAPRSQMADGSILYLQEVNEIRFNYLFNKEIDNTIGLH